MFSSQEDVSWGEESKEAFGKVESQGQTSMWRDGLGRVLAIAPRIRLSLVKTSHDPFHHAEMPSPSYSHQAFVCQKRALLDQLG